MSANDVQLLISRYKQYVAAEHLEHQMSVHITRLISANLIPSQSELNACMMHAQ